jgi:chromosome segregation protein
MMFTRLRLSGFKSFVEPTELLIEPGLTGIVGPNGCGKSNLLEALRWAMGESSTRNVRASAMDDVIFGGTATRPARNMAEVALTLDNTARRAPAQFNDADALEISRRIEREQGSDYRINGAEVRARDVQILFADASSGARSPALVRQGQISEIINAKPQSRRRILEEAAGITGLHVRRHEAELKLRGAETNLSRIDDVIGQLDSQLQGLKRQARQAIRYKELAGAIRRLEAAQLYLAWTAAVEAAGHEQGQLDEAVRQLAERTRAASEASRVRDAIGDTLPALREEEMVRAAVLQRVGAEQANLDREMAEAQRRKAEIEARGEQIGEDMRREQDILNDVDAVLARLRDEDAALREAEAGEVEVRKQAASVLERTAEELGSAQKASDEAQSRLSQLTAQRSERIRHLQEQRQRTGRLESELATLEERRQALQAQSNDEMEAHQLRDAVDAALHAYQEAEGSTTEAEQAHRAATAELETRRQAFDEARREAEKLATEVRTLTKLLGVGASDLWPPLVDAVKVAAGYEAALAAALGDDIEAPANEASPVHWRSLPPLDEAAPLPRDAELLSRHVEAPAALARALSQTGVVSRAQGAALQPALRPGQRLVSREGDLWRWDGYVAAADAPTAAATRLTERNRLGGIEEAEVTAQAAAESAKQAFEAARREADTATARDRAAREGLRAAAAALEAARGRLAAHERATAERVSQAEVLAEAARRVAEQIDEGRAAAAETERELEGLADPAALEQDVTALRATLDDCRRAHSEARARHDGLAGEARMRAERLGAISCETTQWRDRAAKAASQVEILEARAAEARAKLAEMADLPAEFEAKRGKLMTLMSEAEASRNAAGDALQEAENRLKAAEAEWRSREAALGETREEHARLGARLEAARERCQEAERRIRETLDCEPDNVVASAGLDAAKLPAAADIEPKLAQLRDQRERLGAVNLRAETEAQEVAAELERLTAERDDLVAAVHKLRQGIASLNREGRERLLQAFETVNGHFAELFTRLFTGGKAELQLVESDDPLEAGLELLAHPPGKRQQVLSLLSGGEQALTALALIFAVFLTNPSPICVLDEVDAPLDDHNVERFCNLLGAMLERTNTRFLIITHNPITMARMDRLYGVTMAERGVSQLVSVDLDSAERLREAG